MQPRKSKDLIYIAIYQLMHSVPYKDITVKMICEKAGVSRMSFYRYYSTKEDIFINYSDERFADFYELYMNGKTITLKDFTKNVVSYFKEYQRQIKMLEKAHLMYIFVGQFEKYTSYLMNQMSHDLHVYFKGNPLLVPYFSGGLSNILAYWTRHDFKESEEEIARYFEELISKQMVPDI